MRFSTLLALPALLPMFGTEAMLAPAPNVAIWHHEGQTKAAARAAGLSEEAGANLAFHADAIDRYLHSPFWLVAGGLRRLRAVRRRRSAWETLHFDDLDDGAAVAAEWERISGGAVCGVLWAATSSLPRDVRLRAAEHVIGLGMHAIQDFYSHSTWIDDPRRRSLTWQDERALVVGRGGGQAEIRAGEPPDVLTGSYLHATPSGGPVHGGFVRGWLVGGVGPRPGRPHPASTPPDGALPDGAAIPLIGRWHFPRALVSMAPGLNLDSRWQAKAGVRVRGLDLTADQAFKTAYELAVRSSTQWLWMLRDALRSAGQENFWLELAQAEGRPRRNEMDAFENPDITAHLFLTAGEGRHERTAGLRAQSQWWEIRPVAGERVAFRRSNPAIVIR